MKLAATLAALRERIQQRVEGRVPELPDFLLPSLDGLTEKHRIARDWAANVGTVNPRPAGVHNRLVQIFKRALARSLRWYGYPQREFNHAVLEALAETQQLLAEHNRNLLVLAQVVSAESNARGQIVAEMQQQIQQLSRTLASLPEDWEKKLHEQRSSLDGRIMSNVARLEGETREVSERLGVVAGDLVGRIEKETSEIRDNLRSVDEQLVKNVARLNDALNGIQKAFWDALNGIQEAFWKELARHRQELRSEVEEELKLIRLRLRSLMVGALGAPAPAAASETPAGSLPTAAFDYPHFEALFRGAESEVRERQKAYLPFFEGCAPVLDIACGRGEFLSLLHEQGIEARGVDLDADMVARCREQGLEVAQADAFEYLEAAPDDSLGGMFCAQFVEHLPATGYVRLLHLAYRKLKRGGVLLLETQNPECLAVLSQSFFVDPTHVRPVPSAQLRFFMEETGFSRTSVRYVSPVAPLLPELPLFEGGEANSAIENWNREARRFNEKYFGYQDYALVGYKP